MTVHASPEQQPPKLPEHIKAFATHLVALNTQRTEQTGRITALARGTPTISAESLQAESDHHGATSAFGIPPGTPNRTLDRNEIELFVRMIQNGDGMSGVDQSGTGNGAE